MNTNFDDVKTKSLESDSVTQGGVKLRDFQLYRAHLAQAGTADPTAVIFENSVGTITLARTGVGVYTLTRTGAFPAAKTFLPAIRPVSGSTAVLAHWVRTSDNVITITTTNISNVAADLVGTLPVELYVYN